MFKWYIPCGICKSGLIHRAASYRLCIAPNTSWAAAIFGPKIKNIAQNNSCIHQSCCVDTSNRTMFAMCVRTIEYARHDTRRVMWEDKFLMRRHEWVIENPLVIVWCPFSYRHFGYVGSHEQITAVIFHLYFKKDFVPSDCVRGKCGSFGSCHTHICCEIAKHPFAK